jgi:hypothetical protein
MTPTDFLPEETKNIINAKSFLTMRLQEFNMTVGKLGVPYAHNYFVSGGCFASYLQGEEPKDIDIYFIHEKLAKRVIDLYTNDPSYMNEVAVFSEKYRDVKGHPGGMCITENAVTLKNGLQLITKHYGQPKDLRASFDFVHCMPYYDSRDGLLYISREQYNCCVNKCLVINNSANLTTWREDKFKKRGYDYGTAN